MHFVSQHTVRVLIRSHKDKFSQSSGEKIGQDDTIWLQMMRSSAPKWAVEQASDRITFSTRPKPGELGGEDVPVERWAAYIDTDVWAEMNGFDETILAKANDRLLSTPDVVQVDPPVIKAPWPNYERDTKVTGRRTIEIAAQNALDTARDIGIPIADLIAYERSTRNDPDMILVFEAAEFAETGEQASEDEVVHA